MWWSGPSTVIKVVGRGNWEACSTCFSEHHTLRFHLLLPHALSATQQMSLKQGSEPRLPPVSVAAAPIVEGGCVVRYEKSDQMSTQLPSVCRGKLSISSRWLPVGSWPDLWPHTTGCSYQQGQALVPGLMRQKWASPTALSICRCWLQTIR